MSRQGSAAARPWHRHLWPWLLALPPVSAMVFWAVILLTMASPPSLVVDDYAKVGLVYAEDRSRDRTALAIGAAARLRTDRSSGHVSLHLAAPDTKPASLRLTLTHPLDAQRDRIGTLTRNAAGIYEGNIGAGLDGRRRVLLEPADRAWRLTGELPAEAETLQLEAKQAAPSP